MDSPDGGLSCGVCVAPTQEPGYIALSIRYSFPHADDNGTLHQAMSPMAGLIVPVPQAPVVVTMLKDLSAQAEYGKATGFSMPFLCGEVGHCQAMYSVQADVYLVGFGLMAGYFSRLESVWEPIEEVLATIHREHPWPMPPIEWLQKYRDN